jgi:hypothetical protein
MKSKKGFFIGFAIILATVFIASPYYSAWKIIHAVQSGSVDELQHYINFESLQASTKQQFQTSLDSQLENDPMLGSLMKAMLTPMVDILVEDLIDPEKLALIIQQGRLKSPKSNTKDSKVDSKSKSINDINWYAFFVLPHRFLIQIEDLALYMEIQDWHWTVTAIGIDALMDGGSVKTEKAFVADVINESPPSTPSVLAPHQIEELISDTSNNFYIDYNYGNSAIISGIFFYSPNYAMFTPTVIWHQALDEDGNNNLGVFSQEELEKREQYNSANRYNKGKWSDEIPKFNNNKNIVTASGTCTLKFPKNIEQYSLNSNQLNVIQVQSDTAVTLTSLNNGSISYSSYTPFTENEINPVIIIRNAQGQALETSGSSSMTHNTSIIDARFSQPMRSSNSTVRVKGTPSSIEIYFPLNYNSLDIPITAHNKPEVLFGDLKVKIKQTRLVEPFTELPFESLNKHDILSSAKVSFKESINWEKLKQKYLEIELPDNANSIFSKVVVDQLKVLNNGTPVEYKISRHTNSNIYKFYFKESSKDWTDIDAKFNEIKGQISFQYPSEMEIFQIFQGESMHGLSLKGPLVIKHANIKQAIPSKAPNTSKTSTSNEQRSKSNKNLDTSQVSFDLTDLTNVGKLSFNNAQKKSNSSKPRAPKFKLTRNPDLPTYHDMYKSRSMNAYDHKGRPIAYLGTSSSHKHEDQKTYFWGEPTYIEAKRITRWHNIVIPIDFTDSDLQVQP